LTYLIEAKMVQIDYYYKVSFEFWRKTKDTNLHKQQHLHVNLHICFWYWKTF
jgi:hypothetical protein